MSNPSAERIKKVCEAAERWRRELRDTSGRNRLRRYRDLKRGTLDLTPGRALGLDQQALGRLLAGRTISLSDLFPAQHDMFELGQQDALALADEPDPWKALNDARYRLSSIHKTALSNSEEKGIDTCFAAIGLAKWKVDQGAEPNAPVVLLPLMVEATGPAGRDFRIEVAGDAHLNPVLTHMLRHEHGVDTEADEADVSEDPPANLDDFHTLLARFEESWSVLPELVMEQRVVVAIFSYSTMPLVTDLEENCESFATNDIIAAIAGDGPAREALQSLICNPNPNQPDVDPPGDEFLVLDADSSQHMAINRVLGGESLVIQGPPGTGKSQTIANLVTALIARGKRVLFVAEKRAAIEAVTKRIEGAGLDDLVMDMHGGVTSRREFARTLAASLKRVSAIPAQDYSTLHHLLQDRRNSLIENDAAVHKPREPWNLCVFHMRERLLAIPKAAHTDLRLSREAARTLNSTFCARAKGHEGDDLPHGTGSFERLKDEIREWMDLGGHVLAEDHPEWSRSGVATPEAAREAFDLVHELAHETLPAARTALAAALGLARLSLPETVAEWQRTARFLAVASGPRWGQMKARLFSADHRATRRALDAPGALSLAPGKVRDAEGLTHSLVSKISQFEGVTGIADLERMPHDELAAMLERLAANRNVVANLPRVRELEARFQEGGIESVLTRIGDDIPPEHASHTIEYAWISRVLDDLDFDDQRLSTFESETHSRHREEFAESDRQHLETTSQRVHRLTAEAVIETMNTHPDETALVKREAAKKSRHLSIRQLFGRAPHVLSALRPCWTMSPILAAEMIPAGSQLFDIVIFDEASQIPPAEAIGSLARAPQAVIAGDSRQLPPTSFFGGGGDDDGGDDDDDLALIGNIESLLDVAAALLRDSMLQWHYRSRDDRLIAFSNSHIYHGSLTAFPGALVDSPISHCLIPFRPIMGGTGTRSNPDEVERVVDLVLKHAREHPDETLGVIAFGQHHADNIENMLMRRLGEINDSSLEEFFSETNEERFFVKNIERVQGDERDVIILSVGYHKDANGNLPFHFGPLLQDGGERRLNVAVTRARSRLTLVSSFSHHDMDPGRIKARGVELLRNYLEYAATGGENLGVDLTDTPLNPFELSVMDGLERRGIPVTPQYGVSGYRVDFACAHPDEPGRMVLAIEADGASYHSSPTARDRDRLRQQALEDKEWCFHRIWSTAWFRDREAELDKAEEAYRRAVRESNARGAEADPEPRSASKTTHPPPPGRGPRPQIPSWYDSITDYSDHQLEELVRWIESDTRLRTDADLLEEMKQELGFRRMGSRIRERFTRAIRNAHR